MQSLRLKPVSFDNAPRDSGGGPSRRVPGPQGLQQSTTTRADVCLSREFRPFREEDEPFFFGRADFSDTLVAVALRQPLVAVLGASGSGNSSVVRAGLMPRLWRGAGGLV